MCELPCWTDPSDAPNPCAARVYAGQVYGHNDLTAEWAGWRQRGRVLVSPDGDRITPERLRGLLFREAGEQRIARAKRTQRTPEGTVIALHPKPASPPTP